MPEDHTYEVHQLLLSKGRKTQMYRKYRTVVLILGLVTVVHLAWVFTLCLLFTCRLSQWTYYLCGRGKI